MCIALSLSMSLPTTVRVVGLISVIIIAIYGNQSRLTLDDNLHVRTYVLISQNWLQEFSV